MAKRKDKRKEEQTEELLFESDKVLQAEKRRRIILPAAIVAGILLLVVVIALIVRGTRKERVVPAEEMTGAYAYTWDLDRKGVVTLTIDHAAYPDAQWVITEPSAEEEMTAEPETDAEGETVETAGPPTPVMLAAVGQNTAKNTVIHLTPQLPGLFAMTVQLQNGGDAGDVLYQYRFVVQVTSEVSGLRATPYAASGTATPGRLSGGEGTGYAYTIVYAGASDLQIRMQVPGGEEETAEAMTESGSVSESAEATPENTAEAASEGTAEAATEERTLTPEEASASLEADQKEKPSHESGEGADPELEGLSWDATPADMESMPTAGPEPASVSSGEDESEAASSAESGSETAPATEGETVTLPEGWGEDVVVDMWLGGSSDEEVAIVSGPFFETDGTALVAYVRAGSKAGGCTLTIENPYQGVKLTVTYERTEDGSVMVTDHALTVPEA